MRVQSISMLYVYYEGDGKRQLMGRLARKGRQIFFEYHPDFLKTELELSPFKLPLKPGVCVCQDRVFEGLWGVFNDSLPDGWGRLLLDRKLMQEGINPGMLSPLDRLRYVGCHGMGALTYEPAIEEMLPSHDLSLDDIADEVHHFQEGGDLKVLDDLLAMAGSSAGARPKVTLRVDGKDWIIKFRSTFDPQDSGPVEYAYHLMAKAALLDVPSAHLFPSQKTSGFFGVERFDRKGSKRFHVHTVSGLLHADHRMLSLDYETIMKATLRLTRDRGECIKQLRAAVFNVLAHNRDDHAKNFSFRMDGPGMWRVSPAYDLTFSTGPAGEHSSTIMREGKNPHLSHLLKLATVGGIAEAEARHLIEEVRAACSRWISFAQEAGVTSASRRMIQGALQEVSRQVFS